MHRLDVWIDIIIIKDSIHSKYIDKVNNEYQIFNIVSLFSTLGCLFRYSVSNTIALKAGSLKRLYYTNRLHVEGGGEGG